MVRIQEKTTSEEKEVNAEEVNTEDEANMEEEASTDIEAEGLQYNTTDQDNSESRVHWQGLKRHYPLYGAQFTVT